MYLIRQKNLENVRLEAQERCNDGCTANLADTTHVDNNSSKHVTARNIGCLDPFSDLYIDVVSAFVSSVALLPYDIRDHGIFGGLHGCHGRRTACMGLPQAGWTKCNFQAAGTRVG